MSGQQLNVGPYRLIPWVGLVMLARTRRFGVLRTTQPLRSRKPAPRYAWLASSFEYSNGVRPAVARCVGNGSMLARGGSLMERLWIREVRRAARCASARQVALGCGATAVGTIVAFVLPPGSGMGLWGRPSGPLCGR
jgi:hypothetical protein